MIDVETLRGILVDRVLLLCHVNADPDSICSAYAFMRLLEALDPPVKAEIVLTGGASKLSKRIIEELKIGTVDDASTENASAMIVFDASTRKQLEKWGDRFASFESARVFIDHHAPHPEELRLATLAIIDESASSTCEMVCRLYKSFGASVPREAAMALIMGIAYDSRRFTLGSATTFRIVADLLDIDGALDEILEEVSMEPDRSEKLARLKSAQRMEIHDVRGWIVAASHVGSFQASAARALISLGADVAIVAGGQKGRIRASLRSSSRLRRATSIHLGKDVAMPLGEEFGGSGSGHSSSAGVKAEGDIGSFLRRSAELISMRISAINPQQASKAD